MSWLRRLFSRDQPDPQPAPTVTSPMRLDTATARRMFTEPPPLSEGAMVFITATNTHMVSDSDAPSGWRPATLEEADQARQRDRERAEEIEDQQHHITLSPPDSTGQRQITSTPKENFPMTQPTDDAAMYQERVLSPEEYRRTSQPEPQPEPEQPDSDSPNLLITPDEICPNCGQRVPSDAELLKATIKLVSEAGVANQLAPYFYDRLFTEHPETHHLFEHTDMDAQHDRILNSLLLLADHYGDDETNSDDPEMLERSLIAMGRQHVRFNLDVEHYAWVGTALLETVHYFAGPNSTPMLIAAWRRAYKYMAGVMLEGESRPNRGGQGRRRASR